MDNKIQAKQNHAFASVTAKIRCADFSARTERDEVLRLSIIRLKLTRRAPQNMCSAHIFKLLIMCVAQNMCSAHIFKIVLYNTLAFLTPQPNALRRSALIQGKAVAHSLNYYRF